MARMKKRRVNKREAILKHAAENPSIKPREIAKTLNEAGLKVTPNYISSVLSKLRSGGDANGKPAVKATGGKCRGRPKTKATLDHLLLAKTLVREVGGVHAAQQWLAQYTQLVE